MSAHCCGHEPPQKLDQRYRTILWIALFVNGLMFGVEVIAGIKANSVSLLADSLDFFGDAANYGISLWVLGMSVVVRAKASLVKAVSMGLFGVWVLSSALWKTLTDIPPDAGTMTAVGFLALFANIGVALLLYAYRNGDSNMRSVWLCTRNDAIGNIAVIIAAVGVWQTQTAWPDVIVASIMAGLALSASWQIYHQAQDELKKQ